MNINIKEKQGWKKSGKRCKCTCSPSLNTDIEAMEKQYVFPATVLTVCILLACLIVGCGAKKVHAETVDLKIIAQIESSGNPKALNKQDDGHGLYQITPIALKDYNKHHTVKYSMFDMYDIEKSHQVAFWMLNIAIPKMLRHYHFEVNARNQIISYNAGIACLVHKKPVPKTTKKYLEKYSRLARAK